ncbi:MAG: metallophosphoesterase [Verrucomicrobia bacterium]|nr:metallophosphoesterase [Verrucomicrobiota bacterium]
MPIHLPPITRRQFLTRSIAVGAGLFISPRPVSAEASDPHSLILLADTHIAADRNKSARDVNMTDNLKTVAEEFIALPKRPSGVLVNGDCAFNTGEPGDYATLTELLKPIRQAGLPIHLTLGNHDARDHFWAALTEVKAVKRPLADKHVAMLRTLRANWFLLDSLETTNVTPGLLGDAQRDWLVKTLDENADKPAVVFAHHNPQKDNAPSGLKDTERFFEVIEPRKQVKAYIFGHTHNWNVTKTDGGIHLINLPPVAYVFEKGKPNGWVQAMMQPDSLRLELHCLDRMHKDHGQVLNLKWRAG